MATDQDAEAAYEEARRRVVEATVNGATALRCRDLKALKRIPPEIIHLTKLKVLDLGGTQISDLTLLASLKSLKHLNIWRTNVRDLTPISNVKTLRRLNLGGTSVEDISRLAALSKLVWLNLTATQVIDLRPLSGLLGLVEGAMLNQVSGGVLFGRSKATKGDPKLDRLSRLENPQRTIQTLAYLRRQAGEELPPLEVDPDDVEPQSDAGVWFRTVDGKIDVDAAAGREQVQDDPDTRASHMRRCVALPST